MQCKIFQNDSFRIFLLLLVSGSILILGACRHEPVEPAVEPEVVEQFPPIPAEYADKCGELLSNATSSADESCIIISPIKPSDNHKIRKVRSISMTAGTRSSFEAGTDILRVLRYDEETIPLTKMQSSADFRIKLLTPDEKNEVVKGYSSVTYELLESPMLPDGVVWLNCCYGKLNQNGTLGKFVYMPTDKKYIYNKVPVEISPKNLSFKRVVRTEVLPGSEKHYVIRFLGKKGMNILFEVRRMEGGSRPKVISRKTLEIPLGTPVIEINGHKFKVYTATTEFLDIEMIS